MINDITKVVNTYNAQKKEFEEKISSSLDDVFKEFFKDNPSVKAIFWRQFTPYFADGEPCVFGIQERYATRDLDDLDEYGDSCFKEKPPSYYFEHYNNEQYSYCKREVDRWNATSEDDKRTIENINSFFTLLDSIPEKIYQDVYGDGVTVIATANLVYTEEYHHD